MNQYRYDTHVHTKETSGCGKVNAKEAVRLYNEEGYQGIVLTDHYYKGFFERQWLRSWEDKVEQYLEGFRKAYEEGLKLGFDVIQAMELTFTENMNDYLVFGAGESFLKAYPELYNLGIVRFKELIKDMDILIFQAHPYRPGMSPAEPSLLDGIEVYNGNPRHDSQNHLALQFASANGLMKLSGSDFHQLGDLARGGIVVPERISTASELVNVIKNNKIINLIQT